MKTPALILALLLTACSGSHIPAPNPTPPQPTPQLSYTDPPAGPGARLVRNPSLTTPTRLVLDLVGPADGRGRGLAFILKLEGGQAVWSPVDGQGRLVTPVALLPDGAVPVLEGAQKTGVLKGAVFQRSGDVALGQPLLRVAVALMQGVTASPGPIPLFTPGGAILTASGQPAPLGLSVGVLAVR